MTFPIVEYESDWGADGDRPLDWCGPLSLDLRDVATAEPFGGDGTRVQVPGWRFPRTIRVSYADFKRDWLRAKRL